MGSTHSSALLVRLLFTFSSAAWGKGPEQQGQPDPETEQDVARDTLVPFPPHHFAGLRGPWGETMVLTRGLQTSGDPFRWQ